MDLRQQKIEKLVIQYFRSRSDVKLEPGPDGEFLLTLQSYVAKSQFGGKEQIRITFDAESIFHNPDWELINPLHPYLEVIRNDLSNMESEDPRLSEAYFPPQPVSSAGKVTIPQIKFGGPVIDVDCQSIYRPHLLLNYKVVFESDERQDYILRLCFDARTGESRHDIVAHIAKLPLKEGRPSSIANREGLQDIEGILKKGRSEIEERVRDEFAELAKQQTDELNKEKRRLETHYQKQIDITNGADEKGKKLREDVRRETEKKLRENLKKEIEDFEKKYAFRSRTYLISVLLIWIPTLAYRIKAAAADSNFIIEGIKYDSGNDLGSFQACPKCGNQQQFAICGSGRHAFCGQPSCAIEAQCATCNDTYCSVHGKECAHCSYPSCVKHLHNCTYGPHTEKAAFCPKCLKSSFEQEIICVGCATVCELCARTFPQELITSCYIGKERFCFSHDQGADGDYCSECGKPVCNKHGRQTKDIEWACVNHSHESNCCHEVFGDSHLTICAGDSTELLCEIHRKTCVVGREAICERHGVKSWQGEPLCPTHVGRCIRCGEQSGSRIYRSDLLKQCVVCLEQVCKDHLERCPVCQTNNFCGVHQNDLPACLSCSRVSCTQRGCSTESSRCKLCRKSYCRHCLTSKEVCITCANPDPMARASAAFPLLEALAGYSNVALQKAAETMIKSFDKCSVQSSENHTFRVVTVHYKPSQWAFWQDESKVRIVANRDGSIAFAILESTK